MNLILGTAQFGYNYGIANEHGKISINEAKKLINYCKKNNIFGFDTAESYGDAEKTLCKLIDNNTFKINSKINPDFNNNLNSLITNMEEKIEALKISYFDTLFIHDYDIYKKHTSAVENLFKVLKKKNLVKRFGISLYYPEQVLLLDKKMIFDVIQFPYNIFDRRFDSVKNYLEKFKNNFSISLQVRSVFLQGLLLMPKNKIPSFFHKWDNLFDDWHAWHFKNNKKKLDSCIAFLFTNELIDSVVVGCDSVYQLDEIYNSLKKSKNAIFPNLSSNDINLLVPSLWRL